MADFTPTADIALDRLRGAISDWAHADSTSRPLGPGAREWDRADLERALRAHGLSLTGEQIDAAHVILQRRSFMGGNYTLDAKAVLAALAAQEGESR